ncbi:MAG: hypothetical protein NC099_04530, partial [Corallococcus sp.]|nr:hypothetical protein [Corallococcus sp.]
MILNFLRQNIRWTFNRNPFDSLLCLPTTERQFTEQLEKLAARRFASENKIDTTETEFCLNSIALRTAKTEAQKTVSEYFRQFWTAYERVKGVFEKAYALFPSDGSATRLERICELMTKCTQFAVDSQTQERLLGVCRNVMQLTEREIRYLSPTLDLFKIKYFCAAANAVFKNKQFGAAALARMLEPTLLKQNFADNESYSQSSYGEKRLISVVDCMGNSTARLDDSAAKIATKLFVYANGRNVFDTFVKCKFGQNTAEFASYDKTVDVSMRYHLQGTSEVRRVTIVNKGKTARKFSVESPVRHTERDADYFFMDNAICLASKKDNLYAAYALVCNNEVMPCADGRALSYDVVIPSNGKVAFDLVTVYAADTPSLAQELSNLEYFGSTKCPYLLDTGSVNTRRTSIKLNLTSRGYELKKSRKVMSERLNYSYQLGNNDVATFVDNAGNSATLLKGFVFGVKGESVYTVRQGLIEKINDDNFHIDADKLLYGKRGAQLTISHDTKKLYEISYDKPAKTLFYFPFEKKSNVNISDNRFTVDDGERKYEIKFEGKIESYTTNAL